MKYTFATFVILCFVNLCFSQVNEKSGNQALSFELGKTGLIYNLVFDHKLSKSNLGFRLWAGSNFAQYLNAVTVGGGSYCLFGKHNHFLELGIDIQYLIIDERSDDQKGFSFVYPNYTTRIVYPSLNAGFRSYGKKTMFRAGFSPGFMKSKIIPGGFISYGFTF